MNNNLQNLISDLLNRNSLLLTALLSDDKPENWENNKHLMLSTNPPLTLEMAINRVIQRQKGVIPEPKAIRQALAYAQNKNYQHYRKAS